MTNINNGKMKRSGSARSFRSVRSAGEARPGSRTGSRRGSMSNPAFVDMPSKKRFGSPGKGSSKGKMNRTLASSVRSRSGGEGGKDMQRSSSVTSHRGKSKNISN